MPWRRPRTPYEDYQGSERQRSSGTGTESRGPHDFSLAPSARWMSWTCLRSSLVRRGLRERSKIQVNLEIPEDLRVFARGGNGDFPNGAGVFTNIHRHSRADGHDPDCLFGW